VPRKLAQSARKRFGQNFLIDGRVIDAVLASINSSPNDAIVEIGPGHGAITSGLYSSGCYLTLIELDRDLVPNLLADFVSKSPNRCRLINQDVLKVDFSALGTRLRVVGNLPYNIATPLLFRLLEHGGQIKDIKLLASCVQTSKPYFCQGGQGGGLSAHSTSYYKISRLLDNS